jgi:phage-related holin
MNEAITYAKTALTTSISDHTLLKGVGSFIFSVGAFLFSGLSKNALWGLICLIVLDCIFAIYSARKNGKQITQKEFFKTPIKLLVYFAMIASSHFVEFGLPKQVTFIDDTMLTFLLITEFLSIATHFANLGYKIPAKLINKLKQIQSDQ